MDGGEFWQRDQTQGERRVTIDRLLIPSRSQNKILMPVQKEPGARIQESGGQGWPHDTVRNERSSDHLAEGQAALLVGKETGEMLADRA